MPADVAINARAAARAELGGVERWARELSARLPALAPERYEVLAPPAALAHRLGHAWEQAALPLRAARHGARLILSPANLAPLAWPRNVVVIHDAAALRHPGWYSPAYAAVQRRLLPLVARRALHVVTVSEFSRAEIIELLGADPARVSVIPGGVGEAFAPEATPPDSVTRPYVLTVASRIARKNLAVLELAAQRLATRGVDLVAAGGGRPQLRAGDTPRGVRMLGHVPEADLPGLYAGAAAFVLPSLHEGFGLPCVEAMAAGVPVVAADRGALPETCGDAAVLVDPSDAAQVSDALEAVIDDGALRARLRTAGLARAAQLTWARSARAVDELLAGL